MKREIRNPSIPLTQKWIDRFLRIRKQISKTWHKTKDENLLYAIYDLDISASTFNILEFMVNAECEANRNDKSGFAIVFVPSSNNPNLSWKEYDSVVDSIGRQWKFQNIVIPLTSLYEKCKGIFILPQRSDVTLFVQGREVYPDLYDGINLRAIDVKGFYSKLDRPNMFKGLRAPEQGLRYVKEWLLKNQIKDPIVTISIREFDFDKVRNSNIKSWSQFAIYLRSNGYHPVVIPDTAVAFGENHQFEGIKVFKECAWNLGLRLSLHESAFVNFFVDHGCSQMAVFNPQCKYIRMNEWTKAEESIVATKEAFQLHYDKKIGDNYKFATPGQWLCYKPDSFENIVEEFERFVRAQKSQAINEASSRSTN